MKTERESQQRDALEALDELTRKAMGTLMDDRPEVPRLKETVRRALTEPAVPEAVVRIAREALSCCGCSPAERDSGHKIGCPVPQLQDELDRALAQRGEGRVPDQPDVGVIIRMVTEYNKFYRRERDAGVAMRAAIDVWRQAMLAAAPDADERE